MLEVEFRQIEREVISLSENISQIRHRLVEISQTKINYDNTTQTGYANYLKESAFRKQECEGLRKQLSELETRKKRLDPQYEALLAEYNDQDRLNNEKLSREQEETLNQIRRATRSPAQLLNELNQQLEEQKTSSKKILETLKAPKVPMQNKSSNEHQPIAEDKFMAALRYFIGIAIVGPIAGITKFLLNPRSLQFFGVATLMSVLIFPTLSWTTILCLGLACHITIALYQSFIEKAQKGRVIECHSDKVASTLIEKESFERPIPNAMLFGFRYANYIGGEGNEPYGMKAWDLCQQLEDRKVPRFSL